VVADPYPPTPPGARPASVGSVSGPRANVGRNSRDTPSDEQPEEPFVSLDGFLDDLL